MQKRHGLARAVQDRHKVLVFKTLGKLGRRDRSYALGHQIGLFLEELSASA